MSSWGTAARRMLAGACASVVALHGIGLPENAEAIVELSRNGSASQILTVPRCDLSSSSCVPGGRN
jgi:hypothetical protein